MAGLAEVFIISFVLCDRFSVSFCDVFRFFWVCGFQYIFGADFGLIFEAGFCEKRWRVSDFFCGGIEFLGVRLSSFEFSFCKNLRRISVIFLVRFSVAGWGGWRVAW